MGFQDRQYYRDGPQGGNPLMWLLTGSLPLGVWFGINVRIHASLLEFIAFSILVSSGWGGVTMSVQAMAVLFGIVLLHEFGHCYGSKLVGGRPTQIMMTPLGGIASADAPNRPWPQFVTIACGPLVNVLICVVCAVTMGLLAGTVRAVPFTPNGLQFWTNDDIATVLIRHHWAVWICWIYVVSYALLLFNILPIWPLDGGQLLRAVLWFKFGNYKACKATSIVGMVGGAGLAVYSIVDHGLLTFFIAVWCFYSSFNLYRQVRAAGPWGFDEGDESWGGGVAVSDRRERHVTARSLRRARKLEHEAFIEQQRIDVILAKVSAHGMHSLNWLEKRALHKATQRQRERDRELSQTRRGH